MTVESNPTNYHHCVNRKLLEQFVWHPSNKTYLIVLTI